MKKTQKKAIELFSKLYGTDLESRLEKLHEECGELQRAIEITLSKECTIDSHLIDECSDVLGVMLHYCALCNISLNDLIKLAIDKSEKRQTNPNYKR